MMDVFRSAHVTVRATACVLALCLTEMMVAPRAATAQSGLPGRPSNPSCLAPARPVVGTGLPIVFQPIFNVGATPTALHRSANDPSVWYVASKDGRIRRVVWDGSGGSHSSIVLDLSDAVVVGPEAGLSGMAFHPRFEGNGFVYVHYSGPNGPGAPGPFTEYVSRFTSVDGGLTLQRGSERVVLRLPQHGIFHHGGKLVFGPDGYLYVGFGDGDAPAEAQDVSNWLGALLRIDVDGRSPYAIPSGNPFARGGGAPELFAWGLRNPYQFSFDRLTGDLWVGDVGFQTWEEINRIVRGGNYGWPIMEGNHCLVGPCSPGDFERPVVEHLHATLGGDALAIMGGYVYRGAAIPELWGRYVYGDFNGNVWALRDDGAGDPEPELLTDGLGPLTGIAEDADGELYFLSSPIRRLVPGTPSADRFPRTISTTGCRDPRDPTRPAAVVIPYDVNVELWSDGAAKDRWIGLPDGAAIDVLPDGDWSFPIGTVLMKDFRLAGQLIETRLLVRHDDGGWAGYTYEWDDDASDAMLLENQKTRRVGEHVWEYPSRIQCLACHTAVAGRSLGPTTAQLNRALRYPSTGIVANQLATLEAIGMLSAPLGAPPPSLPVLRGPAHRTFPAAERARGYLQANCAHCHAPGGPTQSTMDLRAGVPEERMNVCEVEPTFGNAGVPGAFLLTPGVPDSSMLSLRMHALDRDRMPPLATRLADTAGTQLVDAWISAMVVCAGATTTSTTASTTTSATTGNPSSTSSTVLPAEVCTNGIDDDGDLLADCRDADCVAHADCLSGCGDDPTFATLGCRVAALGMRAKPLVTDEEFLAALGDVLDGAALAVARAQARCEDGNRKGARHALRRMARYARKYARRVRSKQGRAAVADAMMRDELLADVRRLRALAKRLRRSLDCAVPAHA